MPLDFNSLWNAYPLGSQEHLFTQLGGGWPALIGNPAFVNTCALRLTVAIRSAGEIPPSELVKADGQLKDGQGNPLIIRVATAKAWLEKILGLSTWGTSKAVGADISDGLIPAWNGILLYRVPNGADASGHVDLWKKDSCRKDCHNEFARAATTVEFWRLA